MPAYDAIIVGLRCAVAPLAMLLARQGYRVLGIDRATFPSDTISTHFLWPRTTAMLSAWGLLERLARTGCPPIESVTLDVGPVSIRGRPDAVHGTAVMYCPRPRVLDAMLVEAAREAWPNCAKPPRSPAWSGAATRLSVSKRPSMTDAVAQSLPAL